MKFFVLRASKQIIDVIRRNYELKLKYKGRVKGNVLNGIEVNRTVGLFRSLEGKKLFLSLAVHSFQLLYVLASSSSSLHLLLLNQLKYSEI